MTITTARPEEIATTQEVVYASDHGIPVKLHATQRCLHTEHRLEFGTGQGVIVLARRQDRFAMVRRTRPTVGETFLELPRGMVDPNESTEAAASRHVLAKTGHELHDPMVMAEHFIDTAIYPATLTTLYGVASIAALGQPAEASVEAVEWWGLSSLRDQIRLGKIRDGHTLTALAHYMSRR